MLSYYNQLAQDLKKICFNKEVYYFSNPGNWGDALIRYGTIKFLKSIQLSYEEINLDSSIYENSVIIYGGGGGWCYNWNHSQLYVRLFSSLATVVVMPSSFEFKYDIPNTIFYVRDKFQSKKNMPNAKFCHDMAFYIGDEFDEIENTIEEGYFFRGDLESSNRNTIPHSNVDLSMKGTHLSDVKNFFSQINKFSIINTDRLHVAIAGCLLKKEVHLYAGSYFKNKAVFYSSILPYFKSVYFHDHN